MRLMTRLMGAATGGGEDASDQPAAFDAVTDGALDTLGSVIRVMGDESFPLEYEADTAIFGEVCSQFAGHVENGAAVPAFDIAQSPDGAREWTQVRRFFTDRRHAEKTFVTERLHNYRGVVEDLVAGLREIGQRDQATEGRIRESLNAVEAAVGTGALPEIKKAIAQTVRQVTDTFAEQKKNYEAQLGELNSRMSSLRQDLVAAREEMKRDALTDAYNRVGFDQAIEQSLNMHFILNQPVTLVMIDLDNFKQVNDRYGHAAGDEVLRALGECLARAFIRKGDMVARYGGDEFAVILNDTSAENSARLIERFLHSANAIRVSGAEAAAPVSCSAGYTQIHASDTVSSLIERADRALYQAKAAGRNTARLLLHSDEQDSH